MPRDCAHVAHEVLDERAIDIVAAEERVARRREDLEHAGLDVDRGDVERAAAEVAHEVAAVGAAVRAVAERGGGRLAEQAHDGEAGDLRGVLRGLALGGVVPGGDRDHRARDRLAEERLGGASQLAQDQRGDFLGRDRAAGGELDPGVAVGRLGQLVRQDARELADVGVIEAAAEQALGAEDREVGAVVEPVARGLADDRTVGREPHERRQHRRALLGGEDARRAVAIDHRDDRVRRAEVDADGTPRDRPSRRVADFLGGVIGTASG